MLRICKSIKQKNMKARCPDTNLRFPPMNKFRNLLYGAPLVFTHSQGKGK